MVFDHIEKWVASKGYGFTREKRFVHHSVLRPLLAKEDVVTQGTLICGEVTKTERGEQFTGPTLYGHRAVNALKHKDTQIRVAQVPTYDCHIVYKDFPTTYALTHAVLSKVTVSDDALTPQQIISWRGLLKRSFGFGSLADVMSDEEVRTCHKIVQYKISLDAAALMADTTLGTEEENYNEVMQSVVSALKQSLDDGDDDLIGDAASIVVAHAKNLV
jgi:hypothetical protein